MISLNELVQYLDRLFEGFPEGEDPSNNGLQVEGGGEIRKVVFGVDACAELFRQASERQADFVFVHHGLSWGGGWRRLTEITADRMRSLLTNRISLYAVHLPLDANVQVGHNFTIARRLRLQDMEPAFDYHGCTIGCLGVFPQAEALTVFAQEIERALSTECRIFPFGSENVRTIGIVSGGGADAVAECARRGVDCLVTGEVKHQDYHVMKEYRQNVIAAGHYRTETPGLYAVAELLTRKFELDAEVVELPTGL